MANSHRRLFRRPPDIADADWSRLRDLLADAVKRQHDFARQSPHVLRFVGRLEQSDPDTFWIAHEPASPVPAGGLFNPESPVVSAPQLIRLGAALFEALNAAHAHGTSALRAHGGVCPGVVLFAQGGTAKLTDFGFAPAVCQVLGADSYVNLAVGPPGGEPPDPQVTGVWEVLPPDVFDRDDRICAFIDPEKYGTGVLTAFEPGSDIIAAGFILHLLAEHQHPYLHADPDAHRLVAMSEFMAMGRYNQARRPDLRESAAPGIQAWCSLVARTLARLPHERPTAAQVVEGLAKFVTPEDAGDNLRRQLAALQELVQRREWDEVARAARNVAEAADAPADVAQRANALIAQAQGNVLLAEARHVIDGNEWAAAQDLIERLLAMPGLPPDLAQQGRGLRDAVQRSLAAWQTADDIDARAAQPPAADPVADAETARAFAARLDGLLADAAILPPVRERLAAVRQRVADRLAEVQPHAQAVLEADYATAREWADRLDSLLAEQDWDALEQGLNDRPPVSHWPDDATTRADAIRLRLDDHQAEHRRRAAVETDHAEAERWLNRLAEVAQSESWDVAERVLADKPRLTYWPREVLDQANQFAAQARAASRRQTDQEHVRKWCAQLKEAVESGDWDRGADLLAQRPAIDDWPPDVLEGVASHQQQVEAHVEARDLERRRAEQETRQATAWFEQANEAGKKEQWADALDILAAPPPVSSMPHKLVEHVDKLRAVCRARLGEEIVRHLKVRTQAVRELAWACVATWLGDDFPGLLDPEAVEVVVDADEFVSDHPAGDGRGLLRVNLRGRPQAASAAHHTHRFDFCLNGEPRRVIDDAGTLREKLRHELRARLTQCQETALGGWQDKLRQGLFPRAQLDALYMEPKTALSAEVSLPDPAAGGAKLEADLAWDARRLEWDLADPVPFVEQAVKAATDAIAAELRKEMSAAHPELGRYASLWSVQWVGPPAPNPRLLPDRLDLQAALVVPPGKPVEAQTLHTIRVTCRRLGTIERDDDVTPLVTRLQQVVAAAQNADRAAIEAELLSRIKASTTKAKATVLPKTIEQPTDQIQLTLVHKGAAPLEATARWDTERFAYILPQHWLQEVARLLGGPATAERPAPAVPVPVGIKVEPPRRRRSRAVALVGVVAAAALGVGLWQLWPSPPLPPPDLRDGNTTRPEPADGPGVRPVSDQPHQQPTPAQNENAAVVPADTDDDAIATGPDRVPTDDPATLARKERQNAFDELDADFQALAQKLTDPTHEALGDIIGQDEVEPLAQDFENLAEELADLPAEQTDAQSALAESVKQRRDQLADWQQRASAYRGVLELTGKTIAEQIALLQTARDAWPTEYVTNLLDKLPPVQQAYDRAAAQQVRGDWRATLFWLNQAAQGAAVAGVADQVRSTHDDIKHRVEEAEREKLTPLLDTFGQWLVQNGSPPTDPLEHMARVTTATEVRDMLGQLDLNYPSGAGPGQWADKAVEQAVFPWTILTDDQRQVVGQLVDWVNLTLPIPPADSGQETAIDLVFVPRAANPAYGVPDPLWMSQTEVTVGQYRAIMGDSPARPPAANNYEVMRADLNHPVAFVPADGVLEFCTKLRQALADRVTVRAPKESEWEYALKSAGTDELAASPGQPGYDQQGTPAFDATRANLLSSEYTEETLFKPPHQDGFDRYAPVRSYPPNRWLLYDLRGNVSEWTDTSVGRRNSIGASFRDEWAADLNLRRLDQRQAWDDVGLRIVIILAEQ